MCRASTRRNRLFLWAAAPVGAATALLLVASPASAEGAGEEANRVDEILVVGKRAQSAETIAGGASVADGGQLAVHEITRTDDLQRILPGLTINSRGNRAYNNVTIRGISSPDFFSPAMQIYIDGAPQTPAANTQPLIDVERVEFLRGPQGTLYGANALGGIINIVTRQPRESRAYVQGSLATLSGGVEAAGTLVLVPGTVFFDGALYGNRGFGRIDDVSTGKKNIDTSSTISGRAALRYAPEGGPFDARISFSRERMRSREELYLIGDRAKRLEYESADYGPIPFLERNLTSAAAQMNWRLGDGFALSSFTSWQDSDLVRDFPGRVPGFLFAWPQRQKSFTQEVRLVREGDGPINGVVGLWYQSDDFTSWKNGFPGYYGDAINQVDSSSIAGFVDVALKPFEGFEISAGARISRDKSTIDASREDTYGMGMGFAFRRSSSYDGFQPRVTASFALADRVRVYGVIARGYKPGGYNHSISSIIDAEPYDPETGVNYELGLKAPALLDGRLDLALSAYLIRSRDKQIYVGILGQQIIRNAAKAESKGIELEATWHPASNIDISGNLALGRSRFTDFVDSEAGISYTGNSIPYAPDVVGRLLVSYTVLHQLLSGDLSFNAGLNYTSRSWFDEGNVASQGPMATFDLSTQLKLNSGSTIRIFVNNVADKIARTSGYVYERAYWTVSTGRSIGVTLRQDF